MSTPASSSVCLVAKIVAADGQHDALADLLAGAVALNEEVGTIVWFAVRTHADTFWIFDAFPDEAARDAHANGAIVVAALMANQHLLGAAPEILAYTDVLASKSRSPPTHETIAPCRAVARSRPNATLRFRALPRPIGYTDGMLAASAQRRRTSVADRSRRPSIA